MSTFENQVDNLRKYLEENKGEGFPLKNAALSEKEEYVKSLYFRMLCTLIRYTGEPSEMQVLYVNRLIAGCNAESKFQDYMKMALDLDTSDISEFIAAFKEDDLRFYFCIDGAILLSVAQTSDKNYELLAELIEVLGINKDELTYLSAVAKSIIAQSAELFNEASKLSTDSTGALPLYPYLSSFYTGPIAQHTSNELYVYSCDKSEYDVSTCEAYKVKRIIFENISIALQKDLSFEGCDEVIIRNCRIKINEYCLSFSSVEKIIFEESIFDGGSKNPINIINCADVKINSCSFRDFTSRTIWQEKVGAFNVTDSSFERCEYNYSWNENHWAPLGGVIGSSNPNSNGVNCFTNCSFISCGGKNKQGCCASCFISNCCSELNSCRFEGCWHHRYNTNLDCVDNRRTMFPVGSKPTDCVVINSANIC